MGLVNGILIARFKLPPFIATLGILNVAKGLALVISGLKPIYFTNTPTSTRRSWAPCLATSSPGFDIPNIVLILFGAALIAGFILSRTVLGRYTYRARQQRRGGAAVGREHGSVEDRGLHARRDVRGSRRRPDRRSASTRRSRRWASATSSTRSRRSSSAARR